MAMTEEDVRNIKVLAGVLIVLSVYLLYCSSTKRRGGKSSCGCSAPRHEGMSGRVSAQVRHLPNLRLSEPSESVESMRDRENPSYNKYKAHDEKRSQFTDMRWKVDAFVGGSSIEGTDANDGSYSAVKKRQELVTGDIETPVRGEKNTTRQSLSSDIIGMTNYEPEVKSVYQ